MDGLQNATCQSRLDSGYGVSIAVFIQQENQNHEKGEETRAIKDAPAWLAFTRGTIFVWY